MKISLYPNLLITQKKFTKTTQSKVPNLSYVQNTTPAPYTLITPPKKIAAHNYHKEYYRYNPYDKWPVYEIDFIWSKHKNSGTNAIKKIVKESLLDSSVNGKVIVDTTSITDKNSTAGFFYKLGFRFEQDNYNKLLQDWLEFDGKRETAPRLPGLMFLPKENIKKCLNYGK